ncbi:Diphthamide biosynthesis protein 1 [Microbotryomycetes sp. JL201]|nr:Diphthamide biosynthesis protein 1 [Microbotryomycetes sp. JL201]
MDHETKTGAPRRRFVGKSGHAPAASSSSSSAAPSSARPALAAPAVDPLLQATIDHLLPRNYNFEIPKTVQQIKRNGATRVALQMPEGLLMYGCSIVDIIERFTDAECVIMGDVTYGACCIDDYTARALGCDMMVHYGHSCLVPVDTTTIKTLYVFVEIGVDRAHLAATVRHNFPQCIPSTSASASSSIKGKGPALEIAVEQTQGATETAVANNLARPTKMAVVGTIQFVAAVQSLKDDIDKDAAEASMRLAIEPAYKVEDALSPDSDQSAQVTKKQFELFVPQVKPLSPGEILGCTAPRLPEDTDALLYVGDGRFHLESIMIANPKVPAFRYDPYTKRLTRELYEHEEMRKMRGEAVQQARDSVRATAGEAHGEKGMWAVVLGTLGRQGNLRVLRSVTKHLDPQSSTVSTRRTATAFVPMLVSELSPAKLSLFRGISTFVQTSCPRLSVDWGYAFPKPLLSPYEASVALGVEGARGWSGMGQLRALENSEATSNPSEGDYPMDFYANESLGEWTPRHGLGVRRAGGEKNRPVPKSRRQRQQAPDAVAAAA